MDVIRSIGGYKALDFDASGNIERRYYNTIRVSADTLIVIEFL